ncbi:STB3 [Candida jiufengensis]|uniref:STB3 n=1 Tax=Candida jiufengensis TaxID=497108 RepID=UPI002224A228|nr:STB3 [Candida jiufengensis]KAI5952605.1 STB3 [Candida jiufengensis]
MYKMSSNSPTSLSNIINQVIDTNTNTINNNNNNKFQNSNNSNNSHNTTNNFSNPTNQQQQQQILQQSHINKMPSINYINNTDNVSSNGYNNIPSNNNNNHILHSINKNTPQLPFNPHNLQQQQQQQQQYNQLPPIKSELLNNPSITKANHLQNQTNLSPPLSSLISENDENINGIDGNVDNTNNKKSILSTSSPEGIQVASKITPTRLANLLIRKGPLPIRHITSQLSLEVSSFELLSLSKQRRLIMAAMEQTDPINNVVFEKIGWGQWAVRKVDSDYIVTEGTEQQETSNQLKSENPLQQLLNPENNQKKTKKSHSHSFGEGDKKMININDLRNQTNLKLGWSKKKNSNTTTPTNNNLDKFRRESITNQVKNLHNLKLPNESIDNAIASDSDEDSDEEDENLLGDERQRLSEQMDQDERLSYSDDDDDEEDEEEEEDDNALLEENEDEEMFTFDESIRSTQLGANQRRSNKSSPPIKFAKRVPTKLSPPPISASGASSYDSKSSRRRKSSSSVPSNSISKPSTLRNYHYHHHPSSQHILNQTRSRLNSIENLDNYLASSTRNSTVSINSPPPAISFSYSKDDIGRNSSNPALSSSPINSLGNNNSLNHQSSQNSNYIHNEDIAKANRNRRKSSFNESHVRSTLNQEKIINGQSNKSVIEDSDTDEEDWQSIGPEFLRQQRLTKSINKSNINNVVNNNNNNNKSNRSNDDVNEEEKSAAFALVNLMSV